MARTASALLYIFRRIAYSALPELGVKDAEEEGAAGDAAQAGARESRLRIGEAGDAEAGEQAKGEIERTDVEAGERAKESMRREGEVADQPEAAGCEPVGEPGGEGLDLGLGEAVEKEVGGDEVGRGGQGGEIEGECAGVQGGQAGGGAGDAASCAAAQAAEHSGGGVDGEGAAGGVTEQELGEKAAVAVAENERVLWGAEIVEERGAGALEQRAEGEVLGELVDGRDGVEVGLPGRVGAQGGSLDDAFVTEDGGTGR